MTDVLTDVLTVEGLCKAFGGIVVADNIDLTLRRGRVLGLIGPNGAGKTSLFNLVCGVVKPDAGRIALDGESIGGLPIRERARRGLARTCQKALFVASALVGLALTSGIVWAGDASGIDQRLAKLAAIAVSFAATWLLRSRIVFRSGSPA